MQILFQDAYIVVVNKPAGLLVHRSAIDRHETQFAMQMLRDQIGAHVYPLHRLDRPTSGALAFALSAKIARELSVQFASGEVFKRYLAIVRGIPAQSSGRIDYPLSEELDRHADRLSIAGKAPQTAITEYRTIAHCELPVAVDRYPTSRYAFIEAIPKTGRKHQIRRHLRHLGHPIIGDIAHGSGKHNRFFESRFGIRRLMLACTELTLTHPSSTKRLQVNAPLAVDFAKIVRELGWSSPA